jgi:CelD/BcsL family acetyltransferase involved in cellulose biosynthesis
MSGLVVKRLESLAELRIAAPAWDELWHRSEITVPTARAELIAVWCECFAAGQPFRALVVEDGGQLVAALPLVERRWMGLKAISLPVNHWSASGDLMLDPRADGARACDALLAALKQDPCPLLWLDAVRADTQRWQAFLLAVERDRRAHVLRDRFAVNRIHVGPDWASYFASRSANHRHQVRRCASRARREGTTELNCYGELPPEHVEAMLRTCFEIEASGWKGKAQTAVLDVPGAWDFYLRQARQLAAWGQLSVTLLRHGGRPIAFEYGWRSRRIYCSAKVGYDEAFGRLSPGQLLRHFLIQQSHGQSDLEWIDFFGPRSSATDKWATHRYPVARMMVALRGALGRAVVAAYRHGGPLVSTIRNRGSHSASDPLTLPSPQLTNLTCPSIETPGPSCSTSTA